MKNLTIDNYVQLEFPFTYKGRLQQYYIDQVDFIKGVYLSISPKKTFTQFLVQDSSFWMQHFRDVYGDIYFPAKEVYY